jgi:hypothetical protein
MPMSARGASAPENDPWLYRVWMLMARLVGLFRPYQPYKHYMRGPGPKCRRNQRAETARQ